MTPPPPTTMRVIGNPLSRRRHPVDARRVGIVERIRYALTVSGAFFIERGCAMNTGNPIADGIGAIVFALILLSLV